MFGDRATMFLFAEPGFNGSDGHGRELHYGYWKLESDACSIGRGNDWL